ncbi:MAG: hypothetical protein ACKERG_00050 [Candidatus Hodgkinia cicadicola]
MGKVTLDQRRLGCSCFAYVWPLMESMIQMLPSAVKAVSCVRWTICAKCCFKSCVVVLQVMAAPVNGSLVHALFMLETLRKTCVNNVSISHTPDRIDKPAHFQ